MDEAAPLLLCLDWYGTCVPAKEMWTTVPYQISELCIQVGKEPRCAFVKLKTGKHCTFNRNSWTAVHGNKNRLIPACVRSALQYLLCSRPPGSKLRSPAQSSDGDTAYERHRPGRRRRHRPAVRRREGAPRSLGGRQEERETASEMSSLPLSTSRNGQEGIQSDAMRPGCDYNNILLVHCS
jgi:hypothetical protein